jgi:hypothetical protein
VGDDFRKYKFVLWWRTISLLLTDELSQATIPTLVRIATLISTLVVVLFSLVAIVFATIRAFNLRSSANFGETFYVQISSWLLEYPFNLALLVLIPIFFASFSILLVAWFLQARRLSKAKADVRKHPQAKPRVTYIGRLYLDSTFELVVLSASVLFGLTLFFLYKRDYVTSCLIGAAVMAQGGYYGLAHFRVARGWFGDNKIEVEELLDFIAERAGRGGLPPGTTALDPVATRSTTTAAVEEVEGVPA